MRGTIFVTTLAILSSVNAFVFVKKHVTWPSGCLLTTPRSTFSSPWCLSATEGNDEDKDEDSVESLQQKLTYIQALEERNKAQLDSFVDEEDQWESMEEWERELLSSKEDIEKQLDDLLSEQ